jgi:hypothetical protein
MFVTNSDETLSLSIYILIVFSSKEIKDNKSVIECLRKQIAFSKLTGKAVVHLDQFVTLPRAICDTSGINR